ncbi:glycosyltransferase family 4 protein [Rubrivirga sp.]|uniref:glycosyltransferase family 4 protein n=1 Tax=Rubrivirga sp. TaxID=1885344 RepID=UPI003B52A809
MASPLSPVVVLGRFPPPADGQTLATERCASFLDDVFDVRRLDTQAPGADPLTAHPRFDLGRTLHYVGLRRRLAATLRETPTAPVLWHAVSPARWGHLRDVLATAPAFAPDQPVVAVFHRAGFESLFESAVTARTAARLVRQLSAVVFHSQALADRCADVIPESKVRLIPNTVRDAAVLSAEAASARRAEGPGTPLRVLFLSNLLPEKGFADVLEAVGQLHGRGVAVEATFAGRWPDATTRVAFEDRARALGVRVAIPGAVADPAEIRRLHLDADVFALPTTHPTETQPIAILEALAAGTPVVSVDRPILRDMMADGVEGALVRPHDPAALADAIGRLAEPAPWRLASSAARARFEAAFSPAIVGGLWQALAAEWMAAS